jgi:lactoylglutathione lyase
MKIEHIAIWTKDLEKMREFYQTYFNMSCSRKYENVKKGFSSYFLSFETGARIEIMTKKDIPDKSRTKKVFIGFTHIAISVGGKEIVDRITEKLRKDGFAIVGEPRTTGDGYYESTILDPEGNCIEITV